MSGGGRDEGTGSAAHEGLEIAVIGAGAAGLSAAYLLQRRHHVTLFEREAQPGGHVKTVTIPDGPDAGTPVDTGFIVFNDDNYPLFNRLLRQLGIEARNSDMSFSYFSEVTGLEYAGTGFDGLFAQRSNVVDPRFWRLLRDILRFCREGRESLGNGALNGQSLGQFLSSRGLAGAVADDYVLPLAAAIWSASRDDIRAFPAASLLRFFDNHGLLRVRERPQWKTIVGGSRTYVQRLVDGFRGTVATGHAVRGLRRTGDGVEVRRQDGSLRRFDHAVIGVHADQALALLEDPSTDEREALGAWTYNRATASLHTDVHLMPPHRRAWASWNYRKQAAHRDDDDVIVTYHMNRLQGLDTQAQLFVSLNGEEHIEPSSVITTIPYTHPCFSGAAMATQARIRDFNGAGNTYYCGSYLGYGFHEDAVRSGVAVGRHFGIDL